ncbi:hypothetical protein TNCV_343971 [Trichonephila clavipes]|nr:hypothetical protein TNCV_343971 [Trichonephila clavipes]
MVLKANDRRTSCPCHDEFRGPRSDYVRQVVSRKRKPPVFSPQASLVLIYLPTEGMKGRVDLFSPKIEPRTCGVQARYAAIGPIGSLRTRNNFEAFSTSNRIHFSTFEAF